MKTLVVHYDKLTDRKEYLDMVLKDPVYITRYGADVLDFEILSMIFYLPDENIWNKQSDFYREQPPYKKLTPGMVSCGIGHAMIWDYVAGLDEPVLILEDDAILCNGFYSHFNRLMEKLNKVDPSWDVFFVGGAFHHSICRTLKDEGELLQKDHPASNTVCGYVVKPSAADRLFNKIVPFTLPIDFAMNYGMKELGMRVWHAHPYIIREGTSAGFYPSSQVRV